MRDPEYPGESFDPGEPDDFDQFGRHRCRATRRDGQPCQAWAMASGVCFAHASRETRERLHAFWRGERAWDALVAELASERVAER